MSFWVLTISCAVACTVNVVDPNSPKQTGQTGNNTATANTANANTATSAAAPKSTVSEFKPDGACGAFGIDADSSIFHHVSTRHYTWEPGITLNVVFMDGTRANMQKVAQVSSTWSKYANIKFRFYAPGDRAPQGPQLRISFQRPGYWSLIGSQAAYRRKDVPTMNLNHHLFRKSAAEQRRVILHEFGHALGLWHEHQNPNKSFTWNKPVIYDYYRRTHGWSRETVDKNIFRQLDVKAVRATAFDAKSIMVYSFPRNFTREGIKIPHNTILSPVDKEEIAKLYPGAGQPKPTEPTPTNPTPTNPTPTNPTPTNPNPTNPNPTNPNPTPEQPKPDLTKAYARQLRFTYTVDVGSSGGSNKNYTVTMKAPADALGAISHVLYQRQHSTFREFAAQAFYRVEANAKNFEFAWKGWGYVSVKARVVFKNGRVFGYTISGPPTRLERGPDWNEIRRKTKFYYVKTAPRNNWSVYLIQVSSKAVVPHIHYVQYQRQDKTFFEYPQGKFLDSRASGEFFRIWWKGYADVPVAIRVHYKNGTTQTFRVVKPQLIRR